jgi:saccharopine dehydrogenase-like NADP-dependent oxidoreductase
VLKELKHFFAHRGKLEKYFIAVEGCLSRFIFSSKFVAMKTILVLGAGRSSSALITYLLQQATVNHWQIVVGDLSLAAAQERIGSHAHGNAISFSIEDPSAGSVLASADVVLSLLPASLHPAVARFCLQYGKHLLTASYVSEEMKAFDEEAKNKGLLFLNECGLDPGIDHMSAVQIMDSIRSRGGVLTSFESYTGGLIAPETDPQNPWRYKFTWNARNVVMAGQGTAKFIEAGQHKYVPYQQLFKRITPVNVPGYGEYDGYANRDSLKYIETYGLHAIKTMVRGTLRNKGYCGAWNVLVQLGCCDDSYSLDDVEKLTHQAFIDLFVPAGSGTTEERLCNYLHLSIDGEEMKRLRWSGFFSTEKIGLTKATPAQVVEHILNKKWKLNAGDNDMIVMWHRFRFTEQGVEKEIQSSLVVRGDDAVQTAMAKTVGLPLGIAAKLLLQNRILQRGVVIPISRQLYEPIMQELGELGIAMKEWGDVH